jgi:hypothetical protein
MQKFDKFCRVTGNLARGKKKLILTSAYRSDTGWLVIALRPQTPKHIGAAGHIILTPANQLMVIGLKIWSLSNPGSNQRPFVYWPTSLPLLQTALTVPTQVTH